MAIERKIPSNVCPEAAALLERAYAIDSDESSRASYRDWAESYDETMLLGLGYRSPATVARLLGEHLTDRQAPVPDIGCGTGLAGHKLAELQQIGRIAETVLLHDRHDDNSAVPDGVFCVYRRS